MFTLRRAVNPLRSSGLRSLAAAHLQSSYHTKSDILHQISPINLHEIQPNHGNLFTFRGFNSQSEQQQQERVAKKKNNYRSKKKNQEDGFSEIDEPSSATFEEEEEVHSNPKYVPLLNSHVLNFYVSSDDLEKAEQVFKEIQDSGSPVSSYNCQRMIRLYNKFDKEKIKSVLSFMEENDVEPTLRTFLEMMLVDDCLKWRRSKRLNRWDDLVEAMEKSVEAMEKSKFAESMESDGFVLISNYIRAEMARHYISRNASWFHKAKEIMKQMERKQGWEENRVVCKLLLTLYADIGKADEVERIWKVCESFGRVDDYSAAISAFCKLGRVEKAEEVFEKGIKVGMSISHKGYADLMYVYLRGKLLAKAADLVERMESASRPIGSDRSHYLMFVRDYCDALVKLCAYAGDVEKADFVLLLQKALKERGDLALQKEYSCSYYLDMDDSSIVKKRLKKKELKQRMTTVY